MRIFSRTTIKRRNSKKTNPELSETIKLAMNNKPWFNVAKAVSVSTQRQSRVNLEEIDKQTKTGETVVVPGKVLSNGNVTKKVRIAALGISEKALEKLKETKSEFVSILDEIKKNPKAEGIKIVR